MQALSAGVPGLRPVSALLRCPATDETAAALSGLAQMQALDLRFCAITNAGMQALSAGMPALRRVVIDGCPLTSLGVWRLLMAHKRLCLWSPGERPPTCGLVGPARRMSPVLGGCM